MNNIINQLRENRLRAYDALPKDIGEHYGIEQVVLAGGYGYRQVLELVQNGADAILEAADSGAKQNDPPRIVVMLDGPFFYVANTGAPFSEDGIDAILRSHSSPKRGNQIGRFGLGFKSLLRLGCKIDIISGDLAFGFDPDRCRTELKERYNVTNAPGLRLAWTLDEDRAAFLRNLFPWAITVVCAELRTEGFLRHLQSEIDDFPSEFLLFLSVAVNLTLDSGAHADSKREVRREEDGSDVILHEGNAQSRWRVVEQKVQILDPQAKQDATHIHTREEVPIAWGIPLEGKREEAGRFWAFFPTQTQTRLPGILNAPWKLNSDRNGIISGEWNTALMKEAANLIVKTLPQLRTDEDPARLLDAFPRQLERIDEDASPLIEAVLDQLETAAVIPDSNGILRSASELWQYPRNNVKLAQQWMAIADEATRSELIHPLCLERQRDSRIKKIADRLDAKGDEQHNLHHISAEKWFSSIASIEKEKAINVLKLVAAFEKDCKLGEWSQIRSLLAVIPSDDDRLLTEIEVVFAPEGTSIPDGRRSVAQWLSDDSEIKNILTNTLGVKPLDDDFWLGFLKAKFHPDSILDEDWIVFWERLRTVPENVSTQFIRDNFAKIRIRRRNNKWVLNYEALLPGGLVESNDQLNKTTLVDTTFHQTDERCLKLLQVSQYPDGIIETSWYSQNNLQRKQLSGWLDKAIQRFQQHLNEIKYIYSTPDESYLIPDNFSIPSGWIFLEELKGIANVKLTNRFLKLLEDGRIRKTVIFGHMTRRDYYKQIELPHPLLWYLLRYGTININDKIVHLGAIVKYINNPVFSKVVGWQAMQPRLEILSNAISFIDVPENHIQSMWQSLIEVLSKIDFLLDDSLQTLWSSAAQYNIVPQSFSSVKGEITLNEVFVTNSPDLAQRARSQNHYAVTLDARTLSLWIGQGARNLEDLMKPDCEYAGPVELLTSVIPELNEVMIIDTKQTARCQPVTGLKLLVGSDSSDIPCMMWDNTLLLDRAQLLRLSRAEKMKCLLKEVSAARWLNCDLNEALLILGDSKVDELRAYVAEGASLEERLLRVTGGREEPLRTALGHVGISDFINGVEPLTLAKLVLAQLGPVTLITLKEVLGNEGLKPPARWNTSEARTFVASIGFPEEFAASPESRREAEEYISGPIDLPPLHDFQEEVLRGIQELIFSGAGRRRAVVSLPTGGGKTRVAVEAAVLLILRPEGHKRSVIWVAQTDELCEQAVQAFRQVWINLGAKQTDLRIVRLWGSNPNPEIQGMDKPIVVVASIQTFNSRMVSDEITPLKQSGLVVVDECHHAITPSYTRLLKFLDAETIRTGTVVKDEPAILGLSATPFRTDDEESLRLAKRFDSRWLPNDQAQLHVRLRRQGVLAEVDNEALDSGVELTSAEVAQLAKLPENWDGLDFENLLEAINQRLAGNQQRNEKMLDRIAQAKEGSILFFANSVMHAEEIAARLNLLNIPAAAISGGTPVTARRYFLERFRLGEIRVLCNHTVLSTGFDAPKTDMVLISRAVFSPVRYMQMVGRGLRGEKNGGTARCRIITVMDNLGRFQERHPYHYCERYFKGSNNIRS